MFFLVYTVFHMFINDFGSFEGPGSDRQNGGSYKCQQGKHSQAFLVKQGRDSLPLFSSK